MRQFVLLVSVVVGACALNSSTVKPGAQNQPFPHSLVMLNVTMPDGTANELAVADGDLATVKVADKTYAVVPKVDDAAGTTITVTVKEIAGAQKGWSQVDQFDVKTDDTAGHTPKGTQFAVRVEGVQKQ